MGIFNIFKRSKETDYLIIKQKLQTLFKIEPKFTNFGNDSGHGDCVGLYPENVFEKVQVGYRVNETGTKIKQWIGDGYFIVGDYNGLGDPLIVDINNSSLPIYAIMHDDWKTLELVANSVEDFSKIIALINNTNVNDENQRLNLKKQIFNIVKTEFWNNQIDNSVK